MNQFGFLYPKVDVLWSNVTKNRHFFGSCRLLGATRFRFNVTKKSWLFAPEKGRFLQHVSQNSNKRNKGEKQKTKNKKQKTSKSKIVRNLVTCWDFGSCVPKSGQRKFLGVFRAFPGLSGFLVDKKIKKMKKGEEGAPQRAPILRILAAQGGQCTWNSPSCTSCASSDVAGPPRRAPPAESPASWPPPS